MDLIINILGLITSIISFFGAVYQTRKVNSVMEERQFNHATMLFQANQPQTNLMRFENSKVEVKGDNNFNQYNSSSLSQQGSFQKYKKYKRKSKQLKGFNPKSRSLMFFSFIVLAVAFYSTYNIYNANYYYSLSLELIITVGIMWVGYFDFYFRSNKYINFTKDFSQDIFPIIILFIIIFFTASPTCFSITFSLLNFNPPWHINLIAAFMHGLIYLFILRFYIIRVFHFDTNSSDKILQNHRPYLLKHTM